MTGSEHRTARFVGFAFGLALALGGAVLALNGAGIHGVDMALNATARLAFLYFLPAYAAGALVALFGPAFRPLAKRGRDLGLAFAAIEIVHLSLVARLCLIGAAPGRSIFILFGTAEVFVLLLVLFSFAATRRQLPSLAWQAIRVIGMNYIAYVFFIDLKGGAFDGSLAHRLYYLPFLVALMLAVLCRAAALLLWAWGRWAGLRLQQKA